MKVQVFYLFISEDFYMPLLLRTKLFESMQISPKVDIT